MKSLLWVLAILALIMANYAAARRPHALIGRIVLWGTILPALALTGISAARLLYVIWNSEEVNARFAAGDLTYFGADMAFGVSVVLAVGWALIAYASFQAGRARRRRGP